MQSTLIPIDDGRWFLFCVNWINWRLLTIRNLSQCFIGESVQKLNDMELMRGVVTGVNAGHGPVGFFERNYNGAKSGFMHYISDETYFSFLNLYPHRFFF